MDILDALVKLRNDIMTWVRNNIVSLNNKIEENKDYNNLINTPTIPKNVSDLDDDLGLATTQYVDLVKQQIPTKTSQLENDSNFLTEHQSLENYVTKDDAFSGDYNDLINAPDITEDDSGNLIVNNNAASITTTGEGWFAGDVYVGSANGLTKDEGSKKLATEEFVANSIAEEAITWGTFSSIK